MKESHDVQLSSTESTFSAVNTDEWDIQEDAGKPIKNV